MPPMTLVDLAAQGLSIVAICEGCGRCSGQWHPWKLIERCQRRGWSQELAGMERHFRCRRCGPMTRVRLEHVATSYPKEKILTRSEMQKLRRGEPGSGPPGPRQGMGARWWAMVRW